MESIKTVKTGANLVITGSDKAVVEAAARALVAKGGKIVPRSSLWEQVGGDL